MGNAVFFFLDYCVKFNQIMMFYLSWDVTQMWVAWIVFIQK